MLGYDGSGGQDRANFYYAHDGCDEGHGKQFGQLARACGLEGKLTATFAGDDLRDICEGWVEGRLGPYPHSKLTPDSKTSGPKKQGTRMIKCVCEGCGYTARTTGKWLDEKGTPICPCNKEAMKVEMPAENSGS